MFKNTIYTTKFSTVEAEDCFRHITGHYFNSDVSFLSTLRALVAPRMKEGESICLEFEEYSYTHDTLSRRQANQAVTLVSNFNDNNSGVISIHNFVNPSQENNYAWMELIKSTFTSVYSGFYRLEKVTDFFRKTFYVLCFINPEKKNVAIYVENMDIRKMHYLQCSIFAFLPWYFDPKAGVSKLEMELIESLRDKNSKKYEECIERISEQYDFRTSRIRRLLAGFETRFERKELQAVSERIQSLDRSIQSYNSEIFRLLTEKRDVEVTLLGLQAKISRSSEESEIMDYFLRNKQLILDDINDTYIFFTVKSYLEYFDEDAAHRAINNFDSYIYKPDGVNYDNIINKDDMYKLMNAVFIEQTIRIKVCAAYRFSMRGRVTGIAHHSYNPECREYTPNPHIDAYNCLGNHVYTINELLSNHDYIGAIEQCSASCKSINFNDGLVMCELMKRIYGTSGNQNEINIKCFELPNGTVVTPNDAIKWIEEQEVQANE